MVENHDSSTTRVRNDPLLVEPFAMARTVVVVVVVAVRVAVTVFLV